MSIASLRGRLLRSGRLLMLVSPMACASSRTPLLEDSHQPIIGGAPTPPGSWPNVVWLERGCTGVLLRERFVLYSAHCGLNNTVAWMGDELQVQLDKDGTVLSTEGGVPLALHGCVARDKAEETIGGDLAVCELNAPVEVADVPLIDECGSPDLRPGARTTLVGFGLDGEGDGPGRKHATTAGQDGPASWCSPGWA